MVSVGRVSALAAATLARIHSLCCAWASSSSASRCSSSVLAGVPLGQMRGRLGQLAQEVGVFVVGCCAHSTSLLVFLLRLGLLFFKPLVTISMQSRLIAVLASISEHAMPSPRSTVIR